MLDDHLTWDYQIIHMLSKVSSGIYSLKAMKHRLNPNVLKLIYGMNVWGPMLSTKQLNLLRAKQRIAIQLINTRKDILDIRKNYGILNIDQFMI